MFSSKFENLCNHLTNICDQSDLTSLHASCLFTNKKILSSSSNYSRTRMSGMNFPSIHSEVGTIIKFYNQMFKQRFLCKDKSSVSVKNGRQPSSYNKKSGKLYQCIL